MKTADFYIMNQKSSYWSNESELTWDPSFELNPELIDILSMLWLDLPFRAPLVLPFGAGFSLIVQWGVNSPELPIDLKIIKNTVN